MHERFCFGVLAARLKSTCFYERSRLTAVHAIWIGTLGAFRLCTETGVASPGKNPAAVLQSLWLWCGKESKRLKQELAQAHQILMSSVLPL